MNKKVQLFLILPYIYEGSPKQGGYLVAGVPLFRGPSVLVGVN